LINAKKKDIKTPSLFVLACCGLRLGTARPAAAMVRIHQLM
jgi:hypothetical protein